MNYRDYLRQQPLRIGVSTRALFNLEEEHRTFVKEGVTAYASLQRALEEKVIEKGAGFQVVERLLKLNEEGKPFVEVILLSRNSPDLSLRAFSSISEYGLNIKLGSFTSGRSLAPFVPAWGIDLFLSNHASDVKDAVSAGTAAAHFGSTPDIPLSDDEGDEVRIAFDGDAVVFSAESDLIYQEKGLIAFFEHELENARKPMAFGPFGNFLKKLSVECH